MKKTNEQSNGKKKPLSYMLFVHYPLKQTEVAALTPLEIKTKILIPRLKKDLEYLNSILNGGTKWKGFAFVFVDIGWTSLLEAKVPKGRFASFVTELWNFREDLTKKISDNLSQRIKLVTAADLIRLLEALEEALPPELGNQLWGYLAGGRESLLYDGAKVIESAIRIANIGRNSPILRFDDDVIFSGSRIGKKNPRQATKLKRETLNGISRLCDNYRRLADDPDINYFVFSGGYIGDDIAKSFESSETLPTENERNKNYALNGFATRVAELATVGQEWNNLSNNTQVSKIAKRFESKTGDEKADDERLTKILKSLSVSIRVNAAVQFLRELVELGANPFRQTISGAGYCLSDGAILDLTPFSNMRQNVVWIDDHHKYALHHELRHFGFRQNTGQVARVNGACFTQLRHPIVSENRKGQKCLLTLNDVRWHLTTYLPRLVLGCVVDAWLRADVHLKRRLGDLAPDKFEKVIANIPGCYAKEFAQVILGGWARREDREPGRRQHFRAELWTLARRRLNEVVKLWSKVQFNDTYLQVFISGGGANNRNFRRLKFLPSIAPNGFAKAVKDLPEFLPNTLPDDKCSTSPLLQDTLLILIEDFVAYIDLVIFWRHFIPSVRSLLNWKEEKHRVHWLVPREHSSVK